MPKEPFKNYFLSIDNEDPKFIDKLKNLITLNLLSLLKRSEIPYISRNESGDQIKKHDFFLELVNTMQADLDAYCNENGLDPNVYDLEVFLAGGAIRSILGYIYESLYKQLSHQPIATKKIDYIDKLHKELLDQIEGKQLAEYLQNYIERNYLAEIKSNQVSSSLESQGVWAKPVRSIFMDNLLQALLRQVKLDQEEVTLKDLIGPPLNIEILHKFIEKVREKNDVAADQLRYTLNNIIKMMKFNQELLALSEFELTKSKLTKDKLFAPGFVLGVGSDLDVYYRLSLRNKQDQEVDDVKLEEAKVKLKDSAKKFINSVRDSRNLMFTGARDEFVDSILLEADVKEIDAQIARATEQGGSLLDVLAFKLKPELLESKDGNVKFLDQSTPELLDREDNKAKSYDNHYYNRKILVKLLQEDLWEGPKSAITLSNGEKIPSREIVNHILKGFMQGTYDYIPPANRSEDEASLKQAIRGLRPLYEIPFLQLKDPEILKRELLKHLASAEKLSLEEIKQITKLLRNSRLSGGNNRVNEDELMQLLLNIIKKHNANVAGLDEKVYFKQFVEVLPFNRKQQGSHVEQLNEYLISKEDFLARYTDNGILYHGTKSMQNVVPMLRGGFFKSTGKNDNTSAVYGAGLYSTKYKNTAQSYQNENGIILPLHLTENSGIRILDLSKIEGDLKEKLESELRLKDYKGDLNEFLRTYYGIDIIINEHVMIQNANVIVTPDLGELFLIEIIQLLMGSFNTSNFKQIEKLVEIFKLIEPVHKQDKLKEIILNFIQEIHIDKNYVDSRVKELLVLQQKIFGEESLQDFKKVFLKIIEQPIKADGYLYREIYKIIDWLELLRGFFTEESFQDFKGIFVKVVQQDIDKAGYVFFDEVVRFEDWLKLQRKFFGEESLQDFKGIILKIIEQGESCISFEQSWRIESWLELQRKFFGEESLQDFKGIILKIIEQGESCISFERNWRVESWLELQRKFFGEESLQDLKGIILKIIERERNKEGYALFNKNFIIESWLKLQRDFFGEAGLKDYNDVILNTINQGITKMNNIISKESRGINQSVELANHIFCLSEWLNLQSNFFGKNSLLRIKQILSNFIIDKFYNKNFSEEILVELKKLIKIYEDIYKTDNLPEKILELKNNLFRSKSAPLVLSKLNQGQLMPNADTKDLQDLDRNRRSTSL